MDFFENIIFRYASTILSEKLECKLLIHPQFHIYKDLYGNKWEADKR